MNMRWKFSILLMVFIIATVNPLLIFAQPAPRYTVENGAIRGINTGRYNNRPLYINNTNAFILTGDQPIARLAKKDVMGQPSDRQCCYQIELCRWKNRFAGTGSAN